MTPLRYMGDGEFKATNAYHSRGLDKALVIGEVLTWEHIEVRSPESHKHFFAAVHDAWLNLPEAISMEFPTSEHLRKFCLIKAGFCTVTKIACMTNREAVKLISSISEMDSFAVCEVSGNIATVYRAHSQSMKNMGKKDFQASKSAVLEILSAMIGTEIKEMAA